MEVILFLSKSKERTLIIYQWVEVDGGGGEGGGRECRLYYDPISGSSIRLSNILMIPDPPLLALNWRSIFFIVPLPYSVGNDRPPFCFTLKT